MKGKRWVGRKRRTKETDHLIYPTGSITCRKKRKLRTERSKGLLESDTARETDKEKAMKE